MWQYNPGIAKIKTKNEQTNKQIQPGSHTVNKPYDSILTKWSVPKTRLFFNFVQFNLKSHSLILFEKS